MSQKILGDDGVTEIEVYTAEEVRARVADEVKKKEGEYTPKIQKLETDLGDARVALGKRAEEFSQFRKLSEDQVKKLDEKDRVIYENGLALQKLSEERIASDKKNHDQMIDTAIKAKAGTDEKLITKMKDMYSIIGIEANTPQEVEQKVLAVLGAISTTQPDLLASVAGFSGGSYVPPGQVKTDGEKSFGETDKGKTFASELGLKIEADKK